MKALLNTDTLQSTKHGGGGGGGGGARDELWDENNG